MKANICTLVVLGICPALSAGPLALVTAAATHPAVIAGTAGFLGGRLANGGNGGSQVSRHLVESLYDRTQQCVAENGNLREAVGVLRRDTHDLHTTRQELRERDQENRHLLAQQVGLQVDNRHQASTIERLSHERQELRQENGELKKDLRELSNVPHVEASSWASPKALMITGGVLSCAGVGHYLLQRKLSRLDRAINYDHLINWMPSGSRDLRTMPAQAVAENLAQTWTYRKEPLTPELIARLIEEIQKRIRIIHEYLSWKPWQQSIVGAALGLSEEKFEQAEEKLTRLLVIRSGLHHALQESVKK